MKRVRKLESRITENEKNKISIQPVGAGLDDNSDVIPQIPVENRFEILSEKSNSVIPPNQMLYSPQTDVASKTRPEEGNVSKQSESFITGGLPQRVATNLGARPKVYLRSQVPTRQPDSMNRNILPSLYPEHRDATNVTFDQPQTTSYHFGERNMFSQPESFIIDGPPQIIPQSNLSAQPRLHMQSREKLPNQEHFRMQTESVNENILPSLYSEHSGASNVSKDEGKPTSYHWNDRSSDKTKQMKNIDFLMFMDSNGKRVDTELLCPNKQSERIYTPTLLDIQNHPVLRNIDPRTILIHCGTNDFDRMNTESLLIEYHKTLDVITSHFLRSKVLLSSLLPRNDTKGRYIFDANKLLNNLSETFPTVHFVYHDQITRNLLVDNKHLSEIGFRRFVAVLKKNLLGGLSIGPYQKRRANSHCDHLNSNPSTAFQQHIPKFNRSPLPSPPEDRFTTFLSSLNVLIKSFNGN